MRQSEAGKASVLNVGAVSGLDDAGGVTLSDYILSFPPTLGYEILKYLGEAELQRDLVNVDDVSSVVQRSMALAGFSQAEAEAASVINARWLKSRGLDLAYFNLYGSALSSSKYVDVELDAFFSAARSPDPTVVAGLHVGPNEILIAALAFTGQPITLVSSFPKGLPNPSDLGRFPWLSAHANLETLDSANPVTLTNCLRALEAGRTVLIFPDSIFASGARHHRVPFFSTTIRVPVGMGTLVEKSGAQLIGGHARGLGSGRYLCSTTPLGVGLGSVDATRAAIGYLQETIREVGPASWELWHLFDRAL